MKRQKVNLNKLFIVILLLFTGAACQKKKVNQITIPKLANLSVPVLIDARGLVHETDNELHYWTHNSEQTTVKFYLYEMERDGWQMLSNYQNRNKRLLVFYKPKRLSLIEVNESKSRTTRVNIISTTNRARITDD